MSWGSRFSEEWKERRRIEEENSWAWFCRSMEKRKDDTTKCASLEATRILRAWLVGGEPQERARIHGGRERRHDTEEEDVVQVAARRRRDGYHHRSKTLGCRVKLLCKSIFLCSHIWICRSWLRRRGWVMIGSCWCEVRDGGGGQIWARVIRDERLGRRDS